MVLRARLSQKLAYSHRKRLLAEMEFPGKERTRISAVNSLSNPFSWC